MDARPWDFQAEESALRNCADRFNNRRYGNDPSTSPISEPAFTDLQSLLTSMDDLEDDALFNGDLDKWIDMEVLREPIEWETLLTC